MPKQIYLTTTGAQAQVNINDLGSVAFNHPTVSEALILPDGNFTENEIRNSDDLSAAITNGYITISDNIGTPLSVATDITGLIDESDPAFYQYIESTSQLSTTSTNREYLTTTVEIPVTGYYKVTYSATLRNSSTSAFTRLRVQIDDSVNISYAGSDGWLQVEHKDKGSSSRVPCCGWRTILLSKGSHIVDLDFGTSKSTAYCYFAAIDIERKI